MTVIAFHFNAPDRLAYVCRLLRKAVGSGAKVVVIGMAETLEQLDAVLWTFSPVDFVPHCYLTSDAQLVAASPVILAASTDSVPHQEVLLNLGHKVPNGFEKFERVIEIVTLNDEDRQLARSRWKHYADAGYTISRHDLTLKASQ
jgi:DNA polymerase-3 subunit chi